MGCDLKELAQITQTLHLRGQFVLEFRGQRVVGNARDFDHLAEP
jgi:hypothetical protein